MPSTEELENENELDDEESLESSDNGDRKKEKKDKKKKEKKKGKGFLGFLLFILIIGGLVAILGFNVGGIREKYLRSTLEKIPVVKNLLPPAEGAENDEYSGMSQEQAVSRAKSLEVELEKNKAEMENYQKIISDKDTEIKRLKEFENAQVKFKTDKAEFDRLVALNDPDAYKKYYEQISPENAETLYKEVVQTAAADKELKDYVNTFENMKKGPAAKVLEELIGTDMDLVVRILNNISSEQRADILASMDPINAAACTKRMSPDNN
ncbi:MAG: hypothetical protein IJ583_16580 [Firmicutes bacterium]|nr:hypothetical protein [Bacillota bacterium]